MFSLEDLLGQEQGSAAVSQISQQVGTEPSTVSSVVQAALPAILGGLANNASTSDGAQSLNNALEQHHDGGILDNLGGLGSLIFGGQATVPPPQADGGGILGHIFGNRQGQMAQQVSNQTGVSSGQVAQILLMLAPIVMGYLGQQKQQQGVGADGLGGLIGGLLGGGQAQQASAGGVLGGLATSVLDSDHDGSAVDDIASMAFNYIRGK
ncbi:MAG: DUF937 domain-containing protein [Acidobacteriota bacterium]